MACLSGGDTAGAVTPGRGTRGIVLGTGSSGAMAGLVEAAWMKLTAGEGVPAKDLARAVLVA